MLKMISKEDQQMFEETCVNYLTNENIGNICTWNFCYIYMIMNVIRCSNGKKTIKLFSFDHMNIIFHEAGDNTKLKLLTIA